VAYVLGRSKNHARLAAMADALLQDPARHRALQTRLLEPIRRHLLSQRAAQHSRAQSTRVEFFTVARESGAGGAEGEGDGA
jgi:alpha-D-ribose 1-methylphosphonate 5-triphosphate synthase subunit PhnG